MFEAFDLLRHLPDDWRPAAALAGGAKVIQLITNPVFRVGDYEVGDGYCPRLHGHPGIRY